MIKNYQRLKRKHWFLFLTVQAAFLLMFSFSTPVALAQTKASSTESLKFTPQISIPNSEFTSGTEVDVGKFDSTSGKMQSDLLGRYMLAIINYALASVAILATVVLMGGGLLWLTSRGDSGQVSKAKGLIGGSLTGMILLLCSWIILNTINPELTKLQSINTIITKPLYLNYLICCDPTNGETKVVPITIENGKKIAAAGENKGKEVGCPVSAPECKNGYTCGAFGQENYSCKQDLFCCTCATPTSNTSKEYTGSCKQLTTRKECESLCGEYLVSMTPPNYVCGKTDKRFKNGSMCVSPK